MITALMYFCGLQEVDNKEEGVWVTESYCGSVTFSWKWEIWKHWHKDSLGLTSSFLENMWNAETSGVPDSDLSSVDHDLMIFTWNYQQRINYFSTQEGKPSDKKQWGVSYKCTCSFPCGRVFLSCSASMAQREGNYQCCNKVPWTYQATTRMCFET